LQAYATHIQALQLPGSIVPAHLHCPNKTNVLHFSFPTGSGTRNIHSLLAAAGVWMHPDTNKEFDSNVFIKRVKETPAFGMPGGLIQV
jgi:hypothetical protein